MKGLQPNFLNNVPNFLKDVLKVPKSIPRWGTTSNNFSRVSKGSMDHKKGIRVPVAQ